MLEGKGNGTSDRANSWRTYSRVQEIGTKQEQEEGQRQREGTGEKPAGKEVVALGPLFCEAGSEVSHLLRARMNGMD